MKAIYVAVVNHGYEGRTAPIQAFENEADAKAAVLLAETNASYGTWEVYEVPIWPEEPPSDLSKAKRVWPAPTT